MTSVSIIIPCFNEQAGLQKILPLLKEQYDYAQIIVVNDGSTEDIATICKQFSVTCLSHPYNKGNGAAIKTGARYAKSDILVFMDADNQHNPTDIKLLLDEIEKGYDLVIGARDGKSQASFARFIANKFYNVFASLMVGHKVKDLTSGFRAVNRKKFIKFLHLLPNGFSYPTTSTIAFFRAGFSVNFVPIKTKKRIGKSHLKPIKDGVRFLLIIYKVATLYSPLKIFFPLSVLHFLLGCINYYYTYHTHGRFTNMSGVLLTSAVIIFLIGLVSEQITMLSYSKGNDNENFN